MPPEPSSQCLLSQPGGAACTVSLRFLGLGRRWPVEERPPEHPAKVVWIPPAQSYQVRTRAKLAREIDIPLQPVIVPPPRLLVLAMRDQLTIHVQPALIEEAGKEQ